LGDFGICFYVLQHPVCSVLHNAILGREFCCCVKSCYYVASGHALEQTTP